MVFSTFFKPDSKVLEVWNTCCGTEELRLLALSYLMLISAFITGIAMFIFKLRASYGRYTELSMFAKYAVDSRLAWFIQESPSFFIAFSALFRANALRSQNDDIIGAAVVFLFCMHYAHRSFVYPYLIRGGGKSVPVHLLFLGMVFTCWNGYIQGHYHRLYAVYQFSPVCQILRAFGLIVFVFGMAVNLHSDSVLRNLRSGPNDKSYRIPYGGFFRYVSGANFFGEIVEWFGFAMFAQTWTSLAFALFTFANTAPRALEHHKWYKKKFEDYPRERKAVIPFLL